MTVFIGTFIFGVLCIVLGILNMKGNISSIHSYHRNRLAQEDIRPFGRGVGLGTIIVGGSIIAYGALFALTEAIKREWITLIGVALLLAGIAVGLVISLRTIIKYNKGIF